jgi:hemerythrin
MAFFTWDESYSVGVKAMDEQHKRLFDILNEYYEAAIQRKTKEVTGRILAGLLEYTRTHFGAEEKMMSTHGYAGLEDQKAQHAQFVNTVQDYQKRLDEGKMLLSVEVTNFLKDWLVKHIQSKDRLYGPPLNAKGVL